jgi:hypothetical protein
MDTMLGRATSAEPLSTPRRFMVPYDLARQGECGSSRSIWGDRPGALDPDAGRGIYLPGIPGTSE